MLKLTDITKDYILPGGEAVHALKGVSLEFRRSEFVSILGPSGCGKTTLMNIIGGLDGYTSGDLVIDGVSTKQYSSTDWDNYRNKKIGFVFQNYNLISHQSVLNNVELALTLSGVSPEERKRRAKEALEKVGLGDQINKKPNQLSGGQSQRVAIARALVNSPDILLADEPTGALDTATSEQIMELIKDIAKEKLVIMVTHNPDIAERYSTRLVRILDGVILSDSSPYDSATAEENPIKTEEENPNKTEDNTVKPEDNTVKPEDNTVKPEEKPNKKGKKVRKGRRDRTAMSFLTALTLSFRNLYTKKGRTILTSIAGSIGIIGIALILSLSNGMNQYIDKLTTDTLSGNPITVTETAIDIEAAMDSFGATEKLEEFPTLKKIIIRRIANQTSFFSTNVITEDYINYLEENLSPDLYNDIVYTTGMTLHIYTDSPDTGETVTAGGSWQMLVNNDFLSGQYDVLEGRLPESENDLLLIVDQYNRLSDSVLVNLRLLSGEDTESENIDFSNVIGKEYYFLSSADYYSYKNGKFSAVSAANADLSKGIKATVCGIARINPNTDMGVQSAGIGMTKALYNTMLEQCGDSEIVKWMEENPGLNPLTGTKYDSRPTNTAEQQRATQMRSFGGNSTPNSISIYAKDFQTKEEIKRILNEYNVGKEREEAIIFTDMSELMGTMLSSMVNIISYVLIAFTAISLVVSCVMIGIITYISVMERTKEIGILRAIGARKKDITRVFNAETFIIGLIAGIIGIVVTAILNLPIGAVIKALTGVGGIAKLNVLHAFILIAVSVVLTMLSGLIPAFKASKKDPVLALRSE